jgi:hypothetical protein
MLIDQYPADMLRSRKFDWSTVNEYFNKEEVCYASKGRWAFYHIIKSFSLIGSIALPSYLCSSLLLPCKKLGIKTEFYGFDINDLNPSVKSFEELLKHTHVDAVLVPSMYGFAADLKAFELVCKNHSIVMIDDAAQSFGATQGEQNVGTFGDAGFFSFSPGKPIPAHLGAFFWSDKYIDIHRKKRSLVHRLIYLDYWYNRLRNSNKKQIGYFLNIISIALNKIDLSSDRLESWEEGILNEAINNLKLGAYDHRVTFYNIAKNILSNRSDVRVIGNNRGRPAPCKIVLYFSDAYQAASVKQLFNNSRIYTANGYKLIDKSTLLTDPSSQILELPIVSDRNKMDIIFEQLNSL